MYEQYEIHIEHPLYPKQLLDLEKPPEVIYVIGNPHVLQKESLGIIGSRKSTPYGNACAQLAGKCAAECSIPVVSGGAIGCDYQGLKAAMDSGGEIIVVPGCGADVVYPESSRELFERAWTGQGCVVSLEKWGTTPRKYTFPKRNPIIAALSKSLIIIEAATTIASTPKCGSEPWEAFPFTIILKLSQDAILPPGSIFIFGASKVPQICMPNIASAPSKTPSLI